MMLRVFLRVLFRINSKLRWIMAKLDELKQEVFDLNEEVTDLRLAIDLREARDTQIEHDLRQANAALQAEIDRLVPLINSGASEADLQAVFDSLVKVRDAVNEAANDVSTADES